MNRKKLGDRCRKHLVTVQKKQWSGEVNKRGTEQQRGESPEELRSYKVTMWKRKREHRERSRSWASTPSMCLHIWWALLQGPCAPGASKLCLCKCADALTLLLLFLSYPLLFLLALLPLLASLSFCLLILCLAPPFLAFPPSPPSTPPLFLSLVLSQAAVC